MSNAQHLAATPADSQPDPSPLVGASDAVHSLLRPAHWPARLPNGTAAH